MVGGIFQYGDLLRKLRFSYVEVFGVEQLVREGIGGFGNGLEDRDFGVFEELEEVQCVVLGEFGEVGLGRGVFYKIS